MYQKDGDFQIEIPVFFLIKRIEKRNCMEKQEIPQNVLQILSTLNTAGYEAYIVGGCVRDFILHREPQDWDITTSALPNQIKALFPHTVDTGIQHGTVTVVCDKVNYEVTTYRIDGTYSDGRHPDVVSFTPNLEEDLLRRDFTMNAMAYHPQYGLQDPYCGEQDIADKQIRGVGEPAKRFQEDGLRMLRCVRFASQLGFSVEPATYTALQQNAVLIEKISVERIREELDKLWKGAYIEKLPLLLDSGLLPYIDTLFAEHLLALQYDIIPQLKQIQKETALLWTVVLQKHTEEQAKTFCKKLKFDNQTMKQILLFLRYLWEDIPQDLYSVRKQAGELGEHTIRQLLHLQSVIRKTDISQTCTLLEQVILQKDCLNLKMLAVDGKALMASGVPTGKAVGEMLSYLLEDVLHDPTHNTPEYLMALATQYQTEQE